MMFDWITPLLALLSGNTVFAVPKDMHPEVKAALLGVGIKVHHEYFFEKKYIFTVKRKQARWAKYTILNR